VLGWLLLHLAIGAAGTWLARRYALHRDLVDQPGERRSHRVPTPRGGGVAIVIALLVASCVLAWRHPQHIVLLATFAIGLVLVAGVGMIDDHRPLSPWFRLTVHVLAAAVLALGIAGTWGSLTLAVLAFAAALVLTNIWNFMDGINGIAATQAVLVAAGLALVTGGVWTWLAVALVGACLGFLPFNFPRARIFLGDVGSGALGFTLATLVIAGAATGGVSPLLLFLPFSTFLVDSGLTLLRRVARRERWWTPHDQHAYQRWAAGRGTHTIVTLAYAGWTAAALLLAWGLRSATDREAALACAVWLFATIASWIGLQYSHAPERGRLRAESEKDKE
jgi:UDP-N-acetylmuramyl pentapeptide phosphotransferase/UDP-N-acetylglucosamine-1-phosphate transferase